MTKHVVGALQIGSSPKGTQDTIVKILSYEREIIDNQIKLLVLPEAVIGGYPKGSTFDTYVGYRLDSGRKEFAKYFKEAITIPGPEIGELEGLSKRTGAMIATGVIERDGSTLYCTIVYIDPDVGYIGKHRKLMPTASERLIWGQGDGSTLFTANHKILGNIGGGICWENYMPLFRASYYAKDLNIYIAPTVDEREIWQCLIRTIATEGRQYAITAVQFLPPGKEIGMDLPSWDAERNTINGGSCIVNPYGEVLAGLLGKEGLISTTIDLDTIIESRYDFDCNGHYSRNDIFELRVNEKPMNGVSFKN